MLLGWIYLYYIFFFFSSEKESTDHNINLPDFLCFVTNCDSFGLSILLAFPICQHPNNRHIYGGGRGMIQDLSDKWRFLLFFELIFASKMRQDTGWAGSFAYLQSPPCITTDICNQLFSFLSIFSKHQIPFWAVDVGPRGSGECLPNMGEALG